MRTFLVALTRRFRRRLRARNTGRATADDGDSYASAYDEFTDWTPGADW